jgi:hypothetical protein
VTQAWLYPRHWHRLHSSRLSRILPRPKSLLRDCLSFSGRADLRQRSNARPDIQRGISVKRSTMLPGHMTIKVKVPDMRLTCFVWYPRGSGHGKSASIVLVTLMIGTRPPDEGIGVSVSQYNWSYTSTSLVNGNDTTLIPTTLN